MPGSIEIQHRTPSETAPLPRLRPTELFPREPLIIKSKREDLGIDVALLELSDIYLGFPTLTFVSIKPAGVLPPVGVTTVLMGFPAKRAQQFGLGFAVFRYVEYPTVVDPGTRSYSGFDPQTDFLLDYPASKDYHPGGFSGGGIWGHREAPGIWHPDPQFLGMACGYYSGVELLHAVSARRIAEFMLAE